MLGHWSHRTIQDSGCRLDPPSLMEWGGPAPLLCGLNLGRPCGASRTGEIFFFVGDVMPD